MSIGVFQHPHPLFKDRDHLLILINASLFFKIITDVLDNVNIIHHEHPSKPPNLIVKPAFSSNCSITTMPIHFLLAFIYMSLIPYTLHGYFIIQIIDSKNIWITKLLPTTEIKVALILM